MKVRSASGANRVYIISTTGSNSCLEHRGREMCPTFATQAKEEEGKLCVEEKPSLFLLQAIVTMREAGLLSTLEKWAKVKLNWIFSLLPRLASFLLRLLSFTGSQLSIHCKSTQM